MGAVCYKPKPTTISKEDVLRALNDKHIKESITDPDGIKTHKTDEQQNNLLTFGNLTQQLQIDTHEIQNSSSNNFQQFRRGGQTKQENAGRFGQIELNILTYYGYKEDIYETLTLMSRKSLFFMKKNYKQIEKYSTLKHANEKIKLIQVKSIEEHSSGVNQLLKFGQKELVTVSDDCYLKFWNAQSMRVESSLATETVTCIAVTGHKNKDMLVAGCHSGNLILINTTQKLKKEQVASAHYNLIRVIVSLESLKNKYFVTADVCGIVKVWTSSYKPQPVIEIDLEQAISYNSMIEVQDVLPKRSSYEDSAMIACALKSQKVNLILLIPQTGQYQIIKTLKTSLKPTCLIQLSTKHLAVAVGSLKESSCIEIHDINKNIVSSKLYHHNDMIDSLIQIHLPPLKTKTKNQYVTWLISASRDRQMVLWKLIDGKIMKRSAQSLLNSMKKTQPVPPQQQPGQPSSTHRAHEEQKIQKLNANKKKDNKRKKKRGSRGEDEDSYDENNEDEDEKGELLGSGNDDDHAQASANRENELVSEVKNEQSANIQDKMLDYYYVLDSGHKDFIRSMVQLNDNTLITASEDKTIKIFTIGF